MARHAKNNTASSYFTYHERKNLKDYGTQQQRLGKDSLARFDWCCLTLTTAVDPVITYAPPFFISSTPVTQCMGSPKRWPSLPLPIKPFLSRVILTFPPPRSPDGYLYSKEAIYENLLAQKKEVQRKLAVWKEQQKRQKARTLWAEGSAILTGSLNNRRARSFFNKNDRNSRK